MGRLIYRNWPFFLPFILWLLIGAILNIAYTQKELFFFFNGEHFAGQDTFMEYYTYVGDGLFALAVAILIALFINIRYGIIGAIAFLLQGLAVQLLKQVVFAHRQRPWAMYAKEKALHLVANYHPYTNNSFPSGHTTTAFGIFVLLAIYAKRKWLGTLYFFLALMVAYARVYLAQHFFIDTYFGSLLGVIISMLVYAWLNGRHSFLRKYGWSDKSLLKL